MDSSTRSKPQALILTSAKSMLRWTLRNFCWATPALANLDHDVALDLFKRKLEKLIGIGTGWLRNNMLHEIEALLARRLGAAEPGKYRLHGIND
jgi:hypothetical protein